MCGHSETILRKFSVPITLQKLRKFRMFDQPAVLAAGVGRAAFAPPAPEREMTIQPNQDAVIPQTKWQPNRNSAFQQVGRPTRKLKLGKWIAGGALLLVLGGYWYMNHNSGNATRRPRAQAAPVHIATVEKRDMPVIERTIGTVLANETVQVTPQVQGRVQQVFFKEGQLVKKGDPLFLIDPRPFEAALAQTRGQLAKDQAALDGARRDLTRFQALRTMNAESQQVVDDEAATVAA